MAQVHIDELHSRMQAVDSDSLLLPPAMDKIVRAVLQAVDERESHRQRVRAEQRITRGVSFEQEESE